MNIVDLSQFSEYQNQVLRIAFRLHDDADYSKEEAVKDLVRIAESINGYLNFHQFFQEHINQKEG